MYRFFKTGLIVKLRLNLLFPFGGCSVLHGFMGSSLVILFDPYFGEGSDLAYIVE